MPESIKKHLVMLVQKELQQRVYVRDREKRGLDVGDITAEEFQDYEDDVAFERSVLTAVMGL